MSALASSGYFRLHRPTQSSDTILQEVDRCCSGTPALGRGPEPSVLRCFCAGLPCSRGVGGWAPAGGCGPF
eukprot:15474824-Alexandrium_andersonii.AAC.1